MNQKHADVQYAWEISEMNQILLPMILGSRFSSHTEGCGPLGGGYFYGSICRAEGFGLTLAKSYLLTYSMEQSP